MFIIFFEFIFNKFKISLSNNLFLYLILLIFILLFIFEYNLSEKLILILSNIAVVFFNEKDSFIIEELGFVKMISER